MSREGITYGNRAIAYVAAFGAAAFGGLLGFYFGTLSSAAGTSYPLSSIACAGTPPDAPCRPTAEWVAADAAVQAADIASWQLWIGVAGMFALLATLVYTARATKAAARAAIASEAALEHAREAVYLELRAYVTCDRPKAHVDQNRYQFVVNFCNRGQTPASNVELVVRSGLLKYPIRHVELEELPQTTRNILDIMPSSERGFTVSFVAKLAQKRQIEQGLSSYCICFVLRYLTYRQETVTLEMCWRASDIDIKNGLLAMISPADFAADSDDAE